MLRVDLRKAKPGMELALPVQNPRVPSRVLLRVGYGLTEEIIAKLNKAGIKAVWVRYPSLDCLRNILSVEAVEAQQRVVASITSTFEALQSQASARLDYDQYTKAVGGMVDHIISHPASGVFLGDLCDSPDGLMRHSSTVVYLCVLMGLKLEGYIVKQRKHVSPARAKEITNLGLGAMLHDVGITQLPLEVQERHRDTGDDSDPAWREHPSLGYRMVRGNIEPSAATVVLNHHQRCDGLGYAGLDFPVLRGTNIHIFARIAGLAEQFDRMRNPANLPAQPTVWALGALLGSDIRKRFDPQILRTLLDVVPPYAPGSIVRLSDGHHAVCISHNADNPCRPQVQIIGEPDYIDRDEEQPPGPTIDLSTQAPKVYIAEADGQDVTELNFPAPGLDFNALQAAG